MKMIRLTLRLQAILLAGSLLLAFALGSFAQSSAGDSVPIVTIQATDDLATWAGDPGAFTVFRAGNLVMALNVYLCVSGTASDGVDYQTIGNWVQLPAGVLSNSIVIRPINLGQVKTKTVTVELCPSPLMMPVNYSIGSPSTATVTITPPKATNLPPVVRLTSPPNGAVYRAPVSIPLFAYAADPDGSVATVEFFAAANSLGFGRPVTAVPPPLPPGPIQPPILIVVPTNYWELVWSNAPLGTNIALTVKATDNGGAATVSAPVNVTVLLSPPPPTNRLAIVSIVATDPIAIEGTNCWPWVGLSSAAPTWSNWLAASAVCRVFTNCGPKNATFTLFRSGATNDDLAVTYAIGGTATNGLDYVALPGLATIPAGQRSTAISVVPLDDGPPDFNSTVILKLIPGTNYLVGVPPAAAAMILDRRSPLPVASILPGGSFSLSAAGPDGAWFHVESSTDLVNWAPICTNQVVNGSVNFVDPNAATSPARYYRTMPEAGPPPQ